MSNFWVFALLVTRQLNVLNCAAVYSLGTQIGSKNAILYYCCSCCIAVVIIFNEKI